MTNSISVGGISSLKDLKDQARALATKQVEERKRDVATDLANDIAAMTPVWSGRTVRSISVNASGAMAPVEPKPTDTAAFGETSKMPLGSEPMRPAAMAHVQAQISAADYSGLKPVYVTVSSEPWNMGVDEGRLPTPELARNPHVISEIALNNVKSKYPDVK